MPTLAQKAAYWERELLDLSKRNRMLHFRDTRRSSLVIETPDFFSMYQKIVKDEQRLTFQHPIGRDVDSRAYSLLRLLELSGSPVEVLIGDIHTNQRIQDQMLTLRSLRNKAQLAFDEQGTNLLYLSFGFIHWYDGDKKSGEMNSPFLLVPVAFSGTGAHDFELKLYEDDITINPTLAYALDQKKRFAFPEFDSDKDSFPAYIQKLIPLLDKAGMRFEQKCCLGILSFLKINMYLDLKGNGERIASNPVLQQIYTPQGASERPAFQHDEEPYESRWQVLSADSSQMDAISLSRQGKSFVLQGPPGTGKSQTITNIIAQALADRKKVLFVSEKMAALQVVYRRLEEVGLGDFCLPLHDYKADKKQILRLIARPLTLKKAGRDYGADAKVARLEALKAKLNLYPQDMHRVQSAYQMSVYEAMGRLEELRDIPACDAGLGDPHALDRLTVLKWQDSLAAYGRAVESLTIDPRENPWRGYRPDGFLPEERRAAREQIETYLLAVNDARLLAAQAQEENGLPVRATPGDLRHAASLLTAILHLPAFPQAWFDVDAGMLQAEAEKEKDRQRAYRENKGAADAFFTARPPMERAAEWLESYHQVEAKLRPYGVDMDSLAQANGAFATAADQLDRFARAWEEHAGLFWRAEQPVSAAQGLYDLLTGLDQVDVFSPLWMRSEARENARQVFQASYDHHLAIQRLRAALTLSGSAAASEEDMKAACEAWESSLSGDPAPVIRPVLEASWRADHPQVFSSMPLFSGVAWVRRMDELVQSLGLRAAFPFDRVESGLEACGRLNASLAAIERLSQPFAALFPDGTFGACVRLLALLPGLWEKMPVPHAWIRPEERAVAAEALSRLSALQGAIAAQRESILTDYRPAVFDLPADEMLSRFEREYTSFFGWLKPQKKRDLQAIQLCRQSTAAVDDAEAVRALKALCRLKDNERAQRALWEQNAQRLAAGRADMPQDWAALQDKLASFEAFCRQEENEYIGRLTPAMLDAVPAAAEALRSIDMSEADAALSLWLPDAAERPLAEARRLMADRQGALREIIGLFRDLSAYMNADVPHRQAYPAMKSLAQEQERALGHVITLLRRLSEESRAYDLLKAQRARWLAPAWREDDPQWEAIGRTFDVLSRDSLQGALSAIEGKAPDIALQALRQWREALGAFPPDAIQRLVRAATGAIDGEASAKEQAAFLRAGLSGIGEAMRFMDGASPWAPDQASATAIAEHMQRLADLHALVQAQDARQDQCMLWFGDTYAGWSTDWDRVLQDLKRWRICQTQFPEIERQMEAYRPVISSPDRDRYEIWADRAIRAAGAWLDAYAGIEARFDEGALSALTQEEKEERLSQAADHMEYLDQWLRYALDRQTIAREGLETAVRAFERQNIPPRLYSQAFEKAFLLAWINRALAGSPALARFDAREKDADIAAYRALCRDYLAINRARLQSALIDRVPTLEAGGEMAILKKELSKKAKIMPLRKLFRQIPYLLMKLKPCLMMSPLSVSYFLDSDFYHFDMVIFDEASQIFPQDAIGAILRGDQAIIAGDIKQMPPTDFFSADMEEEEDGEDEEVGTPLGDSILEEADFTLTPQRLLWHYRSRDEQLIAFSNRHFYDDHLYTFPSNVQQKEDMGVEYVFVPDGVYSKRHNDREAETCLRLIREHYRKHPERSLGVVAFNEAQQGAIENLVWEARENDPLFAASLDANQIEPFFIKNLENVQGDERDTIIFSVCFGRAADGKFRYNFGPLGRAGGERRLNVAVTRAKCNVKLVGSIHAEDIDLNRAKSEGARMLRAYIDYACHPDPAQDETDAGRDAFAESVARHLESQGYRIRRDVGRSAYTVDIAVCSREDPSRFAAAVQCDGDNYASARTACDREEIRRTMLENLNWRIVNCWSADWFAHPAEARRMLTAQLEAGEAPRPVASAPRDAANPPAPQAQAEPDGESLVIPAAESKLPSYQAASEVRYLSSAYPAGYTEFMKRILHCVRHEQPISQELLYRRMAPLWNRQVVSSYVREQVDGRLEQMRGEVRLIDGFYVLSDFRAAQPRTAGDREIDQIALEELEADLAFVIRRAFGMERQEAITVTARMMGYQRTGPKIISRLGEALERLRAAGKITIVHDKVQWREEEA